MPATPAWVLMAGSALLGASISAAAVLAVTRPSAVITPPAVIMTVGASPIAVLATARATTAALTATAPAVEASRKPKRETPAPTRTPSPQPVPPHGQVTVAVPIAEGFGQGFGSGRCANWKVLVQNGTNLEVVTVTFAPPHGEYSNEDSSRTIAAHPPTPATLGLSIPAHRQQPVPIQVCTSTRSPGEEWEFNTSGGASIRVTYANGYRGKGTFSVQ